MLSLASAPATQAAAWMDFEDDGTLDSWLFDRRATSISLAAVAGDHGEGGPSGSALLVDGKPGGFAYTKSGVLPRYVLPDACAVSFWIKPEGATAVPTEIEIQFLEPGGNSRFWRRIIVEESGWQQIEMPLRFFRTRGARLPSWDDVAHLGILTRGEGKYLVDNINFTTEEGCRPYNTLRQLREIGLPNAPEGTVRVARRDKYAIMTDAAELDLSALEVLIAATVAVMENLFPYIPAVQPQPVLIVFGNEADYRAFPNRLASTLGAGAPEPGSGGYTVEGVATSFFIPAMGYRRPVFVHEFVHSWLSRNGRLAVDGRWFHEAVANYIQLQFYPQADFPDIVRSSFAILDEPAAYLRSITGDEVISMRDYWALATLFHMFVERESYRAGLETLYRLMLEKSSFNLEPLLGDAFGVDMEQLAQDWKAFCQETYNFY